ncbi:hypothetical protein [Sphingomonas ginkgonis]|uniref:hypothetical protein n=1 Tax=Sphingomonas ginkgonis TaxID=2315330 RepID=UPI0016394F6E|nr:hypothetical protein [Sphingomonas ginkgonis]
MDLNYLYHRQQVALLRADFATGHSERQANRALAGFYGSLIDRRRADFAPGR